MEETMTHLSMKRRLRWLGHLAHMKPYSYRLPKQILYGELDKRRPRHGTRRRWRDVVTADIKAVGTSEDWCVRVVCVHVVCVCVCVRASVCACVMYA